MTELTGIGQQFSQEQLGRLHRITQEIEKTCRAQLVVYLEALAPLFRPRRVLGNHMEASSKEMVTGADQSLAELREVYFKACGRPFELRKDLPVPLESFPAQVQLHEWEYTHEVQTERGHKTINIVSPLTWVLAFPSAYTFSMVRQVVMGKHERDPESLRSFVLRASLMYLMFSRLPELKTLFEGLRYRVEVRKSPQLGDLPLVTISAPVTTIRPGDDLLLLAVAISGRPQFVEVADANEAAHIPDSLQATVSKIIESAGDNPVSD